MMGGGADGYDGVCGFGGALKNRWGQGEGVTSDNKTNDLVTWAGLARFADISAP